jgi:anti-sigma-K factor RskA
MSDRCDRADTVAAYLLGALDEDERGAFEVHLRECAPCREDAESLAVAVQALPEGVEQLDPPPELKRRVMAEVGAQAELMDAARPAPRARARRRRLAWLAIPSAAAVIAAAVLAGYAIRGGGPARHVVSAQVTAPGAHAQIVRQGSAATLEVTGMPAPPAGKVYEVWVQRAGAAAPQPTSSLFDVARGGRATVRVPDLHGVRRVLVTAEPAGGSLRPTSTPVIAANVS